MVYPAPRFLINGLDVGALVVFLVGKEMVKLTFPPMGHCELWGGGRMGGFIGGSLGALIFCKFFC